MSCWTCLRRPLLSSFCPPSPSSSYTFSNQTYFFGLSSKDCVCVFRDQELKVFQARKCLEEALMADCLARAAENTRELLEGRTG